MRVAAPDTCKESLAENLRLVQAHEAGATRLVAGSAIFGSEDIADAYRRLANAVA